MPLNCGAADFKITYVNEVIKSQSTPAVIITHSQI